MSMTVSLCVSSVYVRPGRYTQKPNGEWCFQLPTSIMDITMVEWQILQNEVAGIGTTTENTFKTGEHQSDPNYQTYLENNECSAHYHC